MPLELSQSYENDFCDLLDNLRHKLPEELFYLDGIGKKNLDINEVTKDFFKKRDNVRACTDHSIDPNSNVTGKDSITYNYELNKPFMKLNSLYNIWKNIRDIYGKERADKIIEMEISGDIYINDCWDIGRPYCFNYSTYDIATKGLPVAGRLKINPPKSLSSFFHQMEQFIVYAANMTLGATGIADIFIVSAVYVDKILETGKDHKVYVARIDENGRPNYNDVVSYIHEIIAHFIYTINFEFRGNQSPFTNISLYDKYFLNQLIPSYSIDGRIPSIETVELIQDEFMKVMNEELNRNPVTFPVTTACFSVREEDGKKVITDKEFLEKVSRFNIEKAFMNIYCGDTSTLSSCCRLRSKVSDLGYSNTFGSGSTKIGSLGVVSMNLPRLAYNSVDFNDFIDKLKNLTKVVSIVNEAKREFIKDRISRGALPLYPLGFMDLNRQYSTAGFTGLFEAMNILGYDMRENKGVIAAQKTLDAINEVNDRRSMKLSVPHNMEQVPAESSAVKLAKKDRILKVFGNDPDDYTTLYSNQFTPLWVEGVDLLDRIRIQGQLDSRCTGGAVCHLNIDQEIKDPKKMSNLIEFACNSGVIYFAVNYAINKCVNNHMTVGRNLDKCPICGCEITDTLTRVVGFLTNTKYWVKERREFDFPNRKFY